MHAVIDLGGNGRIAATLPTCPVTAGAEILSLMKGTGVK